MANIKSAAKRARTGAKKTIVNKAVRSDLKTAVKNAELALENNEKNTSEVVDVAVRKIDRASGKGLMHSNKAARKKSQLVRKLNKIV